MKLKKGITLIISAVVGIAVLLGTLSVSRNFKNTREFVADGFILKPSAEEVVTTDVDEQYYFGQGTKYKEKYATKILFKDKTGQDVAIDVNQYLHYADGSLGSFTKGVIMSLADITDEQFGYYSLTKNTILIKNNNSYEMSSRGEKMDLSEFIWKISDTDYMIVSPEVTLHLNDSSDITLPEYAQIKYVDNGIVRIVHQQGTYQTVSADTFLRTQGGAELNLVGKNFYINGEPALSLDSMSIDDDSYIDIDENVDTPELKIPTFNVINGKDGTAGKDGEEGTEGEEGASGEDGEEGVAGAEGQQGVEGAAGQDGVEGDSGIMGYDGAEGKVGKDAVNASSGNTNTTADLLARPTVTMSSIADSTAGNQYEVTPSTATMTLSMQQGGESVSTAENTKIKIYKRSTMEEVSASQVQSTNWGEALQIGGTQTITVDGLNPDTEYVMVVSGGYYAEEGGDIIQGNFFTKIFKTDSLGITIVKNEVKENSVSVKTKVTSNNVDSYAVQFYRLDDTGNKEILGRYLNITATGEQIWVLDDFGPTEGKISGFKMESNTTYYAEIGNVNIKDQNGAIKTVNAGDTAIELKTLKKKPYSKDSKDKNENPVKSISEMEPILTANNKSHTFTLELGPVVDEDNGIKGYRYELYRTLDITQATTANELSLLSPAYTKESNTLTTQTFTIPTSDSNNYQAKIVTLFNDNEKDVEYATLFSEAQTLSADSSSLIVEFIDVNKDAKSGGHPDCIDGYIKVTDPNMVLLNYITTSTPMILTMMGEYTDTYTMKITDKNQAKVINGDTYEFYFSKDGLHDNSTYTLSVSGPCDTDSDNSLTEAEKLTYLAGLKGVTPVVKHLAMAGTFRSISTAAFAATFSLTTPLTEELTANNLEDEVMTDNKKYATYLKYETEIMTKMRLGLFRTLNNVTTQLGEPYVIRDQKDGVNQNQDSDFADYTWVDKMQMLLQEVMDH